MRRGCVRCAFGRIRPASGTGQTIGEPVPLTREFHRGSLRAFTGGGDTGGASRGGLRDFWAGVFDAFQSKLWTTAGSATSAGSLHAIDDSRAGDRRNYTAQRWGLPYG